MLANVASTSEHLVAAASAVVAFAVVASAAAFVAVVAAVLADVCGDDPKREDQQLVQACFLVPQEVSFDRSFAGCRIEGHLEAPVARTYVEPPMR